MKIFLTNNFLSSNFNNTDFYSKMAVNPQFGLCMTKPLQKDTVSFEGTPKLLTNVNKKGGIPKSTAMRIHKIAKEAQPEISDFIEGLFIDYMITDNHSKIIGKTKKGNKKNNLKIEKVVGRAKEADSIYEKAKTRRISDMATVFSEITDLNATKIVMADGSRENTHEVLNVLFDAIRRKLLILQEVEVKRPIAAENLKGKEAEKWDYADSAFLADFVKKVEATTNKKVYFPEPDLTPANYPAIHFLLRLPTQKRPFELQLMGHNVSIFKDLDDIIFKILNNKNVDKKYTPILKVLKTITLSEEDEKLVKYLKLKEKLAKVKFTDRELNLFRIRLASEKQLTTPKDSPEYINKVKLLKNIKGFKEEDLILLIDGSQYLIDALGLEGIEELKTRAKHNEMFKIYRAKVFLFQREKKANPYLEETMEYFLPLTEPLPMKFDMNELYKLYLKCKNSD